MARPNLSSEKRVDLLPVVARTFAELGYRRTTTADLARRCGVRENILYRLWPNKKAMFIASIDHVFEVSAARWQRLLKTTADDDQTAAQRLLAFEAKHLGEFGFHRILFAGLSEADDPDIRAAMARMYQHFQSFISEQIRAHRKSPTREPDAEQAAWAVIGLGTVINISRELGVISAAGRRQFMEEVGRVLLDGCE